jgi:hypothetical protein
MRFLQKTGISLDKNPKALGLSESRNALLIFGKHNCYDLAEDTQ